MPITRILTDSDAQLLALTALDDHVRGSLLRDLEAAGFEVERVDARIAELPKPDCPWRASAWLIGGRTLEIECVARRRLMLGRVAVIDWRAKARDETACRP